MAGGIARQLQDGRTAHAPMGDEQGAVSTEFCSRQMDRHIVDHRPHQLAKPFIVHSQAEQ